MNLYRLSISIVGDAHNSTGIFEGFLQFLQVYFQHMSVHSLLIASGQAKLRSTTTLA